MRYRRLECLDAFVSELCFGTWQIGGAKCGAVDADVAIRLLRESHDRGVNIYETSNLYGNGRSEFLLGLAFSKDKRDEVTFISKAGYLTGVDGCQHVIDEPPRSFDLGDLSRSLHDSLRRLQTEFLDVFLLHDPTSEALERDELFKWMEDLKKSGKARAIGLSTSPKKLKVAVERRLDIVEVIYNAFKNEAAVCLNDETSNLADVIGRTPFHGGLFFADPAMLKYLGDTPSKTNIAHRCLHFVLQNPRIKTVATGLMTNIELQVSIDYWESNCDAMSSDLSGLSRS